MNNPLWNQPPVDLPFGVPLPPGPLHFSFTFSLPSPPTPPPLHPPLPHPSTPVVDITKEAPLAGEKFFEVMKFFSMAFFQNVVII